MKYFSFANNINLAVAPGELVAVVGQVGCGKSSLIASLLSEMIREQGDVTIKVVVLRNAPCPSSRFYDFCVITDFWLLYRHDHWLTCHSRRGSRTAR